MNQQLPMCYPLLPAAFLWALLVLFALLVLAYWVRTLDVRIPDVRERRR